jgi:acylphosphatase
VRNTKKGDMEAMTTGNADRIKEFIEWRKKANGKNGVTKVTVTEKEEEVFEGFRIAR